MMEEAKIFIIKMVQKRSYGTEIKTMASNRKNSLKEKAFFTYWIHLLLKIWLTELEETKKIYIQWKPSSNSATKDTIISTKILECCHINVGHSGRDVTIN